MNATARPARHCSKCQRIPSEVAFRKDKRNRDGLGSLCLPCAREYGRNIPEERRDKYRAAARARYAENPSRRRGQNAAWLEKNRDRVNADRRERGLSERQRAAHAAANWKWRQANPDYFLNWYDANKADQRAKARTWRKANADLIAAGSARRRLAMLGRRTTLVVISRRQVWERDGGICGLCAQPVPFSLMHLDHIVPIAKGGLHSFTNVQPSHGRCNRRKRDRLLPKWAFARAA